jgi:hypothetical protein
MHFDPLLLQGVTIPKLEAWHKSLQLLTLNGWHKSLEQRFLDLKEDASIEGPTLNNISVFGMK